MTSKKAVLISCFNYYDIRLKHVEQYLQFNGYKTTYITSDFDHIAKCSFEIRREQTVQVHAKPYRKNLSVARMLSHYLWARDVFKVVREIEPDLLFVMLPPNSVAKHASHYRKSTSSRLVFDIYDLWPETYPFSKNAVFWLPFWFWRRMRDRFLKYADIVTTECNLFQEKLGSSLRGIRTSTFYPALEDRGFSKLTIWHEATIHLVYLGSINNIIDISLISDLLLEISKHKPVHLHIIGAGEKKSWLVDSVVNAGVIVTDHGTVYDEQKKQEVINNCRFGLNIMRKTVCVGLTMKSIDYFRMHLPIISNIDGDTQEIINDYEVGFHIFSKLNSDLSAVAEQIATTSKEECLAMRKRVGCLYDKMFSVEAAIRNISSEFEDIL